MSGDIFKSADWAREAEEKKRAPKARCPQAVDMNFSSGLTQVRKLTPEEYARWFPGRPYPKDASE